MVPSADDLPGDAQRRASVLLAGLGQDDREVLAQMLAGAFQNGVFIALRVLYDPSGSAVPGRR